MITLLMRKAEGALALFMALGGKPEHFVSDLDFAKHSCHWVSRSRAGQNMIGGRVQRAKTFDSGETE